MIRRRALALAGLAPLAPSVLRAEGPWGPERPVRFIVGFGAGGPSDTSTRLVTAGMPAMLTQPVAGKDRASAPGSLGIAPAPGRSPVAAQAHHLADVERWGRLLRPA